MNRKINLIAPILLVLTLCMLVGPAAAYLLPQSWHAMGTAFVTKNGVLKYGSALIYVNVTVHVTIGLHDDLYNNTIWLMVPTGSPGMWGFLWTIIQTKVLPNGNIMFHAIPLSINLYGNPPFDIAQAGPSAINVEVSFPITAPGSVHYRCSWVQVTPEHALSLNVAYFYGWTAPPI